MKELTLWTLITFTVPGKGLNIDHSPSYGDTPPTGGVSPTYTHTTQERLYQNELSKG